MLGMDKHSTTDLLTFEDKVDSAKQAFYRRADAIGNDDWTSDAWENAFSAECFADYRDDLHRWEIASATLEMLADQAKG